MYAIRKAVADENSEVEANEYLRLAVRNREKRETFVPHDHFSHTRSPFNIEYSLTL